MVDVKFIFKFNRLIAKFRYKKDTKLVAIKSFLNVNLKCYFVK